MTTKNSKTAKPSKLASATTGKPAKPTAGAKVTVTVKKTAKPASKPPVITKHGSPMAASNLSEPAFDIVPPGKVMPAASSRPVVIPAGPVQSDNTLAPAMAAETAPLVHKKTVLAVPKRIAQELAELPATVAVPASAPLVVDKPLLPAKPVAAGRSIAELLSAKQHSKTPSKPAVAAAAHVMKPKAVPEHVKPSKSSVSNEVVPATPESDKSDTPDGPDTLAKSQTAGAPSSLPKLDEPATPAAEPDQQSDIKPASRHDADSDDPLGLKQKEPAAPPAKAELYGGKSVLVIHEPRPFHTFMNVLATIILILLISAAILDFLLDAEILTTGYNLPHTNLVGPLR